MAWSQRAMGTSLYIIIYRLRGSGDFERNHMVNFVEKVVVIHRGEKRQIVSRCSHVWCRSRRFVCILLVFFRRWDRLVKHDLIKRDALLWLVVFQQLWLVHFDPSDQWFAPSAIRCRTALLLFCLLVLGIHASGISIPLSLLMLLGWSLMWIASLNLRL